MGSAITKLLSDIFGKRPVKLCILGLDGAGKTATLHKLHVGETTVTIPTVGFNVETVEYKHLKMTMWDVGGQDRLRPLWRHWFTGTNGLIYVVDSADGDRLEESAQELGKVLADDELRDCAVLVYANKQDLPTAQAVGVVAEKLRLKETARARPWQIQGTCAVTGEGLYEGLEWLSRNIPSRK